MYVYVCSVLWNRVRCGSYRAAGDFSVIEDEPELSGVAQTLCLKPKSDFPLLRNLHLPA